jgi:hypothetical protein
MYIHMVDNPALAISNQKERGIYGLSKPFRRTAREGVA